MNRESRAVSLLLGVAALSCCVPRALAQEAVAPRAQPTELPSTLTAGPIDAGGASPAPAQSASATFTLDAFLATVMQSNLTLAAERANVPIAEARIEAARIFPDPVVSAGVAQVDLSGHGAPVVTAVGVSVPIELGGKRGSRIELAARERDVARAELAVALRELRCDAADAWIAAQAARMVLARKRSTLQSLERLVSSNEVRLRAGAVGESAVVQSHVEAERFRAEVLLAEGEVRASDFALLAFFGPRYAHDVPVPLDLAGELRVASREIDEPAVLAAALHDRAEIRSALAQVERARAAVSLAEANRWVDVSVGLGWQHSFQSGTTFNTPAYDSLSASLSIPLPLSRIYRGELTAAERAGAQSRVRLAATEQRVDVEVHEAVARYRASVSRHALFTGDLLQNAERVRDFTLYDYERGGATLLEVLNAQRTLDGVYIDYIGVLAEHAHALVALSRATESWFVRFE